MCERQRGANTDVIASLPRELFSETNDNSVAVLLAYGAAASSWLATPKPGGGAYGERFVHEALNGHQRSETTHTL